MKSTSSFAAVLIALYICTGLQAQIVTTIYDVQYVDPMGSSDASSLKDQIVQVSGVVTASAEANNLWAVYIQQEGMSEWAGIELRGNNALYSLVVGDQVTVTGTVQEVSGKTLINFITEVNVTGTSFITPPLLDPNIFTTYSLANNEKYEGMLVIIGKPSGLVSVVQKNADAPNNYGEWRVGSDPSSPAEGCRVLTGRQTSSVFSSLNVSYVNDLVWATNSGTMQVEAIEVNEGDEFQAIAGIIDFAFGNFKLLPRNTDDVVLDGALGLAQFPVDPASLRLYPNPVNRQVTLAFDVESEMSLHLSLTDIQGRTVAEFGTDHIVAVGSYSRTIELDPALPSGNYLLVLQNSNASHGLILQKQ